MTMLRVIDGGGRIIAERTALPHDFRFDVDRMMIVARPGLKIVTSDAGSGPFTATLGNILWRIQDLDELSAGTVVHLVTLEASVTGEGT
jgi:hypothetical protein